MTAPYLYLDGLETQRLTTRFLIPEDLPVWTEFFKDKEAVALFPAFGMTSPEDRARHWIDRQLARYQESRFGLQALIHKETNAFIGQCGLLQQEVDGREEVEVGYHIFQKYWGQGYAPEAAQRFIAFAFENHLADSIISIIDVRNRNSQKVADKNGLTREKQTRWYNFDVFIYRIHKDNREQNRSQP